MARPVLLLLLTACADPLDGLTVVGSDPPDLPLDGLDAPWRDRFDAGDALFETPFTSAQGLGPLFIRPACASCHADDGRGPGVVERMAGPPEVLPHGDAVRPQHTAGATQGVIAPADPRVVLTQRNPPAVFARGWIEAVDADALFALEAAQAATDDGVSGRVARVAWPYAREADTRFADHRPGDDALVGRFGLKARVATLDAFTADAFHGDMGLTSAWFPDEVPNPDALVDDALPGVDLDDETVLLVADYVRLLDLPARAPASADGEALFAAVGCAACHVPTLPTRADHPVEALAGRDAPLFTDLLLHDLGDDHDDGIVEGDAGPSEWRTAPLVGLRFFRRLMHDGRAATVVEAIEAHDGPGSEAAAAVAAWRALSHDDQRVLATHVSSL
ncbi:MAG: hypothetical protein H6732_07595 [Alphaproteobacteria bacterium]|nr:hypothetical protein [Alphaproteobacteria bacterium]